MTHKTSVEWLETVKADPALLKKWLERQYVGERLAAQRLNALIPNAPCKHRKALRRIAEDEAKHADWVGMLLVDRQVPLPVVSYDGDRYWKEALSPEMTFHELTAAGVHAEVMRLNRIRALVADQQVDQDIRAVFTRILPDEEFHAMAFSTMTTPKALKGHEQAHQKGMDALGLTA